jgi:hypothetical protein
MGTKEPKLCVFCNRRGRTRTHIFPGWLNRLIQPPPVLKHEEFADHYLSPTEIEADYVEIDRQGSIFSQKPYLCCGDCNTRWMHDFEDEMVKFAKPLFSSLNPITINDYQRRVIAVWISIATILAEYAHPSRVITVPMSDKDFIRTKLMPPEHWTVVACSLNGKEWRARYRRFYMWLEDFSNLSEYYSARMDATRPKNTQISSFGMGNLFIQTFSTPNARFINDYRIAAKSSNLTQLWPLPLRLNPFSKGLTKFPTKTILDDDGADIAAESFYQRINMVIKPYGPGSRWNF